MILVVLACATPRAPPGGRDDPDTTDTSDTRDDTGSAGGSAWADVVVDGAMMGVPLGGGRLAVSDVGGDDDGGEFHGRAWILDDPAAGLDAAVTSADANLDDRVDDLDGDGVDEWLASDGS